MTKFKLNPVTGDLDLILSDEYTPYTDGDSDMYYKKNGYTLELWFRDVMVTSYTIDAPSE